MACRSWWNGQDNDSNGSPLVHSKLSEIEESIKDLLAEVKLQDGDSFPQRDEFYYQRKDELLRKVEAFLAVHQSLTEIFSQFSARSSLSTISTEQHDDDTNIAKVIRSSDQSDSNPESETDDPPELEMEVNSIMQPKPLAKTAPNFLHCTSVICLDVAPAEDTDGKINQQIVCCKAAMTLTNSLEERIRNSERMLQLIEENCNQMNELIRGNEEKREVIRELCGRVGKLAMTNRALQDENQWLMDEKWGLAVKLQKNATVDYESSKASSSLKSSSFRNKNGTSISRFKALILNTIQLGSCHST